jgi:hypothetical protein
MSNFPLKRQPHAHSPTTLPPIADTSIRVLWP